MWLCVSGSELFAEISLILFSAWPLKCLQSFFYSADHWHSPSVTSEIGKCFDIVPHFRNWKMFWHCPTLQELENVLTLSHTSGTGKCFDMSHTSGIGKCFDMSHTSGIGKCFDMSHASGIGKCFDIVPCFRNWKMFWHVPCFRNWKMFWLCPTLQASLSSFLPPTSAVICHITEGTLAVSSCLSTEIIPICLTLSAPTVKVEKSLSIKTVDAT